MNKTTIEELKKYWTGKRIPQQWYSKRPLHCNGNEISFKGIMFTINTINILQNLNIIKVRKF